MARVRIADVLRMLDRLHGREPPPPSKGYGTASYRWFKRIVITLAEATLSEEEKRRLYDAMGVTQKDLARVIR